MMCSKICNTKYFCFVCIWLIVLLIILKLYRTNDRVNYLKECQCKNENFCLPPMTQLYPIIQPKFFACKLYDYLKEFRLLNHDIFSSLNIDQIQLNPQNILFVIAASSKDFSLFRAFVKQFRKIHPKNQLTFYDVGLTKEQIKEVNQLCNVKYVRFEFEKYPPHVLDLTNFAWRVLILAEQLKSNQPFIYLDPSVRFTSFYYPEKLFERIKNQEIEPYTTLQHSYYSIFATTHPDFYQYIPMPKIYAQQHRIDLTVAQVLLPVSYTKIVMKWQVLCALTQDCIAPKVHNSTCLFKEKDYNNHYKIYQNCHNYDQSLYNSLTVRMLIGDDDYGTKFGYTNYKEDVDVNIKTTQIIDFRKAHLHFINQMFKIRPRDVLKRPVKVKC